MKNFIDRLLGVSTEFEVRKRIYISTLLAGMLLTFFGGMMNLLLGLNPFSYIMPFLSLMVFALFYSITRKRELNDFSYRLGLGFTLFIFYPVISFMNGALLGGAHYFFAFFWVIAVAVLPGPKKSFLIAYALVVLGMLAVDYLYPELASTYESRQVRYVDIAISLIMLLAGIYVALNIVMRAYDATNLTLEKKNKELESVQEELTQKNEDLAIINQTKDKFFSIIAHDLRGAFNPMLGFSDLLKSRYETLNEDQKKKYLDLINLSIHNTYDFFENLLEWSRTQRGAIEVLPVHENIPVLVEEVLGVVNLMADKKEISLEVQVLDDLYFEVDKYIFTTVLRNLMTNAIKYTPHHGVVKLRAEVCSQECLNVSVEDTGVGMSQEQVATLFQLSENTSSKGTDNEPGTGLGLVLCKDLVDKHKGGIGVESQPGEGSVFRFTIPSSIHQESECKPEV